MRVQYTNINSDQCHRTASGGTQEINRISSTYYAFLFLVFLAFSCQDFVQIDMPENAIGRRAVFENDLSAIASISNIYGKMNQLSSFASGGESSISFLGGLYTDELLLYSTNSSHQAFYSNSVVPTDLETARLWQNCYNIIYCANSVIEGVTNSRSTVSAGIKRQLEGEARFIRAFCHLYLINLFGDIPYVFSTDYRINDKVERTAAVEVYQNIIDDLREAEKMLSDEYPTIERVRPNKWAATAIISREYLYANDWINAETYATDVINHSAYELVSLNNVFLKNNKESIWQLFPRTGKLNSEEGSLYILAAKPTKVALTQSLLDDFELGDFRRTVWVGSVVAGGVTYYFPYKYKATANATVRSEHSVVIRLAELYLIRAEARAQQGNLTGAIGDLDTIRKRAGLPLFIDSNSVIDPDSLQKAIEHEKRIEFFTEWGHRFFDLKRFDHVDQILGKAKIGWEPTDVLLPIPESEILANKSLYQNLGY